MRRCCLLLHIVLSFQLHITEQSNFELVSVRTSVDSLHWLTAFAQEIDHKRHMKMSTSKSFVEASKAGYEATSKAIQSVKVDHIPAAVGNYVRNHPYSTATGVILAVPMMLPASVAVPVLGGLGFSSTGPVAGMLMPVETSVA